MKAKIVISYLKPKGTTSCITLSPCHRVSNQAYINIGNLGIVLKMYVPSALDRKNSVLGILPAQSFCNVARMMKIDTQVLRT